MADTVPNGDTVVVSPLPAAVTSPSVPKTESELQSRYMQLLEQRVAQLETVVELAAKGLPPLPGAPADGNTNGADDGKPKSRYRVMTRRWNPTTSSHEDTEVDDKPSDSKENGEIAFTFRRVYFDDVQSKNEDDTRAYSEIDIEAPALRKLFKSVIDNDYPGQSLDGDVINIVGPFPVVIHHWDLLVAASQQAPENPEELQACQDLVKLLDKIKAAPECDKYFKTRETNRSASLITYETLWTIFQPKTLIYAKPFLNTEQLLELWTFDTPDIGGILPRKLFLGAWCWEWDGQQYVKVNYAFWIDRFKGTKDIKELDCYPMQYHKGGNEKVVKELEDRLRKRGQRYDDLAKCRVGASQMWGYKGTAIFDREVIMRDERDSSDDEDNNYQAMTAKTQPRPKRMIRGNFIVDQQSFLTFSRSSYPLGDLDPHFVDTPDEEGKQELTGEEKERHLLLLPPRVLGYSTKEKRWGQYAIESTFKPLGKQPDAFRKKLELDDKYKDMIQALVEEHQGNDEEIDPDAEQDLHKIQVKDVVEDKGKGLVLLLHGPPGVGKTLTAETIAEATGKPLFVVSVAEIGLKAHKAERNLEQLFYLAGRWESVLLVDEADVFLESRSEHTDPNRNALVSVLLRVLEYYAGIMILTTNRINSLDVAVQSRIHLAIRYDDLNQKQKIKIFKTFLDQLEPGNIKNYDAIMEFIEEYGSRDKLNGREIRNCVSSALSLARSQEKRGNGDGRLTKQYLREVMAITKDFQEQLESITKTRRGQNEAGRPRN